MKKQIFCIVGILTLAVSGSLNASLVSVDVIAGPQHPDGLHNTWRVVARFSDSGDQISAVNGLDLPNFNPLFFFTGNGSDLYNQELFAGFPLNDFPSSGSPLFGEAWDSYVTIGATNFNDDNTGFSPNFLCPECGGQPPVHQVILGNAFFEDDGAWFFFGAPPLVSDLEDVEAGNDTFDVILAQFTVNNNTGLHFEGNVQWFNPVSGSNNTPFSVEAYPPAPGALPLLGIAGLVGARRRRR